MHLVRQTNAKFYQSYLESIPTDMKQATTMFDQQIQIPLLPELGYVCIYRPKHFYVF